MKPLTTNEITRIAKMQLHARGAYIWRNNNLRVPGRKFNGETGASDLLGYNKRTGIIIACEIKGHGDKLSAEQQEFLRNIKKAGGFALVACEGNGGNVALVDIELYLLGQF